MTDHLSTLLRDLDPLREDELAHVLEMGARRGGAERISATQWRRARASGRGAIGLAVAVAAAVSLAVAIAISLASSSAPTAYALSFSEKNGYVIARIVNSYASVKELSRELAENHLRVTLRLLPVPAGSVGNVLEYQSEPADGVQPLQEGHCVNGPCTVGVKVARGFTGSGLVYIGRPARRGESYASTPIGGAFAPGEALHCSGLQGASVAKVLPALAGKKLSVVGWRLMGSGSSTTGSRAPSSDLVEEVMPVAPGKVELWVSVSGGTGFTPLHKASMRGCGSS
ncbi:MAG: hypothetical protein WB698_06120 [Solirubrobacteraceae bacterium]